MVFTHLPASLLSMSEHGQTETRDELITALEPQEAPSEPGSGEEWKRFTEIKNCAALWEFIQTAERLPQTNKAEGAML